MSFELLQTFADAGTCSLVVGVIELLKVLLHTGDHLENLVVLVHSLVLMRPK